MRFRAHKFTQQCGSSSTLLLHPLSLSAPIMELADFRVSHLSLWQAIIKAGVTCLKSQVNFNSVSLSSNSKTKGPSHRLSLLVPAEVEL